MNKLFVLAKRNLKEFLRDPLSLIFAMGLPIGMLVLLQSVFSAMDFVPDNFKIDKYAVGICVFGYTFVMLFTAMGIAGDKNTEFINRIKMAPIKTGTYLSGFILSMLPIAVIQTLLFFAAAVCFGLKISFGLVVAAVYLIPSAVMYIAIGIAIGTFCKTERQAGPLCSIIITLTGVFGGIFMPIDNLGVLGKLINVLPFSHSVEIASCAVVGNYACVYPHILYVLGYTAAVLAITFFVYKRTVKSR